MNNRLWVYNNYLNFSCGISKRKCASINSKPLFIIVAESTDIFLPIDQFGCLIACSGVMLSKSFIFLLKKGPPDAVNINFDTLDLFL